MESYSICFCVSLSSFHQHNESENHLCCCVSEEYSVEWMYHMLFFHSTADGHLNFHIFGFLYIINKVLHILLYKCLCGSLEWGMAGPCGRCILKIIRNWQRIFQNGCAFHIFTSSALQFSSATSDQHSLWSFPLILVILIDMQWYLTVVLMFNLMKVIIWGWAYYTGITGHLVCLLIK